MENTLQASAQAEEQLVAELARMGVGYLSRQSAEIFPPKHKPYELLAELICQPSSRVRAASIALLLARPDYAKHIPRAIKQLNARQAQTLRFFYTAAVFLQQEYATELRASLGSGWCELPDLFSNAVGVTGSSPTERLRNLAILHAQWSGEFLNWAGTYDNAARNLLHRWEKEKTWRA